MRLCAESTLPLAVLGVDDASEPGVATSSAAKLPAAGVVWMVSAFAAGLLGVTAAAAAGEALAGAAASGDLGDQCCMAGAG